MKIIQVMPEFYYGGAEIMCETLTNSLRKMGHEVIVISLYTIQTPIIKRLSDTGVKIYFLDKKIGLDISMVLKLRKIFKKEKPDIIHTHRYVMEYVVPASLFLGAKRIHTLHSIAQKENSKLHRILNYLFYKLNKVVPVALSEYVRETIVDEYKIAKENIPIIFNGANLDYCIEKRDYTYNETFQILHIGRFCIAKNHYELIKAIKKVHDKYDNVLLKLVGDGELKDEVLGFIHDNQYNDFIKYCGTTDDVYSYLTTADVFILPSIYEGVPMTLIEAMGTALPIIASNVGGIPELLSGAGILCEPNADSIENSIIKMIKDRQLREVCGKMAKKKSFNYSGDKMAEKYLSVYKNVRR